VNRSPVFPKYPTSFVTGPWTGPGLVGCSRHWQLFAEVWPADRWSAIPKLPANHPISSEQLNALSIGDAISWHSDTTPINIHDDESLIAPLDGTGLFVAFAVGQTLVGADGMGRGQTRTFAIVVTKDCREIFLPIQSLRVLSKVPNPITLPHHNT
jgi:hypothetical protein